MNVIVKRNDISTVEADIELDFGSRGNVLHLRVDRDTDHYVHAHLQWEVPAKVTGPVAETRDRQRVTLVRRALALRSGRNYDSRETRARKPGTVITRGD